jgi:hypothetical protein
VRISRKCVHGCDGRAQILPKPTPIKLWSVSPGGDGYTPPEVRGILVQGRLANGMHIRTSNVVAARGRVITTASGSRYRLDGPPCEAYAQWLADNGKVYDPKRPIVVIKAGAP